MLQNNFDIYFKYINKLGEHKLDKTKGGIKKKVAKRGGQVANDARKSYEQATKKSAISNKNALSYKYADEQQKIESKIDE